MALAGLLGGSSSSLIKRAVASTEAAHLLATPFTGILNPGLQIRSRLRRVA